MQNISDANLGSAPFPDPNINVGLVQEAPPSAITKERISEDWVAVIISSILIGLILGISKFTPGFSFKVPFYQWATTTDLLTRVLSISNLSIILVSGLLIFVLATTSFALLGGKPARFSLGFLVIYVLAVFPLILAGNKTIATYGIEYIIFGLVFGLLISNLSILRGWLKEAARSEFYIKTCLVVLGTSVLSTDIVKAGLPGIIQSLAIFLK